MKIPPYVRAGTPIVAFLSLFWFPWTVSCVFMFLAGLVFPALALALGVFADILYYPGTGIPWGSIIGLILALASALVRHFVKTRIM
jgi:hypothetical protein